MKILFVYPTTTSSGVPNKYKRAYLPPLNLAILDRLTYLSDKKHEVKIVNEFVEDIDFDSECDIVGITILTSQAVRAYQIADRFRAKNKKVIVGGVHPSLLPDEALKHADAVVIGEVENIWSEILADIQANRLKRIYQDYDFPDLAELIIPKWDNMDLSIYRRSYGRKMPRMPIYTTRGCVHGCNFCSVSKFFGRSYRCKPIINVLHEINATPAESFFFTDDNIVCKPEYSKCLFEELIKLKRDIRWFSQASTTILHNPELIKLAAKAGCRYLFFGIESINSINLRSANKKFNDPEKYVELSERCLRAGIQPWFSLIFGFDEDSLESMIYTVEYLKNHNIWNVAFWILTPLPGTKLWDEMIVTDRIIDLDWSKYDLNHVVYKPALSSATDLYKNFWIIYRSMYSFSSIYSRAKHALKTSNLKGLVRNLQNQYYSYQQIRKFNHPYSMGIWKKN